MSRNFESKSEKFLKKLFSIAVWFLLTHAFTLYTSKIREEPKNRDILSLSGGMTLMENKKNNSNNNKQSQDCRNEQNKQQNSQNRQSQSGNND